MNEIQEIRKKIGLSQSKFADHFNIPVRTLQKWEIDQAKPPQYLLQMMKKILLMEQITNAQKFTRLPKCFNDLFWDCEISDLDLNKNSAFIIARLYNFGGVKGRLWVNNCYDKETIIKAACSRRDFDPIVANYLKKELQLDSKDMAYYKHDLNWKGQ